MTSAANLLIIFSTTAAWAQTAQFEVASIKPSPPPGPGRMLSGSRGGPGTNDPGLFTCERCSLSSLIFRAFDIQSYQLAAPDWMQTTRFNISAKIPDGATKDQFRSMMRSLLTERFKLQFHFEKKEVQEYDLVVAKSGLKMKESSAELDPDERPGRLTERKLDPEGFVLLPPGRVPMMMIYEGHATERHTGEPMEQLATGLASQLSHPVTDATGLKGKYDFTLRWVAEDAVPSAGADPGPNIFRALQEQLGLKLEPKKGIVDILVVDHLEKTPTEN